MTDQERASMDKFTPPDRRPNEWGSTYAMRVRSAEREWQQDHSTASVSERAQAKMAAAEAMVEAVVTGPALQEKP